MNVGDARTLVTSFAGNTSVTAETAERVDDALQFGLGWFVERTGCTRKATNVSLSSGINAIDVTATSDLEDFFPGHLVRARIGTKEVEHVNYEEIRRLIDTDDGTGKPTKIAWDSAPSDGFVYPKTDAAYTLVIVHNEELTSWTRGGTGATESTVINVPDRWIRQAILYLCAPYLQLGANRRNFLQSNGVRLGMAWMEEVRGLCSMDAGAVYQYDQDDIQ